MDKTSGPEAGWYPHPEMAQTRRYWDGEKWTDHIAPDTSSRPAMSPPTSDSLVGWGILAAILLPVLGLVFGVILLVKGRSTSGTIVLLLSVVVGGLWLSSVG